MTKFEKIYNKHLKNYNSKYISEEIDDEELDIDFEENMDVEDGLGEEDVPKITIVVAVKGDDEEIAAVEDVEEDSMLEENVEEIEDIDDVEAVEGEEIEDEMIEDEDVDITKRFILGLYHDLSEEQLEEIKEQNPDYNEIYTVELDVDSPIEKCLCEI